MDPDTNDIDGLDPETLVRHAALAASVNRFDVAEEYLAHLEMRELERKAA